MTLPRPAPLFGTPPASTGQRRPAGAGVLGAALAGATRPREVPVAPSPTPQGSAPLPAHRPLSGVERDRVVLLGLAAPEDAALLTTTRHRGLDEYPGVPQGTSWWRRLRGTGSPR